MYCCRCAVELYITQHIIGRELDVKNSLSPNAAAVDLCHHVLLRAHTIINQAAAAV